MLLHRDLEPPLKPNRWQTERVLGQLASFHLKDGRLSGAEPTIDAFAEMAGEEGWIARNSLLIAHNLQAQLPYMAEQMHPAKAS